MRFPLPADTFPTLSLPLDDQDTLKNLASAFIDDAVVQYRAFRQNDAIDDARWKLIKKRDGLSSYLDRELGDPAATRNSVRESVGSMTFSRKLHGVLTVGTIDGSLNDQMGVYCGQMKKLNWLLKTKKTVVLDRASGVCSICQRTVKKASSTCQVCMNQVCSSCSAMQKLAFLSTSRRIVRRNLTFCASCLRVAALADGLDVAAEELRSQNPLEFFELSSNDSGTPASPSNSTLPDIQQEFFG
ncbi:hypothetical protein KRP22_004803 [Phytophthora ramorum]|nr:hypothetical protein KRP22_10434 [Phytophthora ramorum]